MKNTRLLVHHGFKQLLAFAILVTGMLLFASCGKNESQSNTARTAYIIPDSILKTLVIDTVTTSNLTVSLKFNGIVDVNPDKVSNVFPLISGVVQGASVMLGDHVRAGQALGSLKSPEMAGFAANLTTAETNVRLNAAQLARTREMAKAGLATQVDVTQAEVAYRQSEAAKLQAEKVIGINGNNPQGDYTIHSPIDGFVVQKNVTSGMAVRADNTNPLYTIADLTNVWVLANVYEANISKVHQGDTADVTTITYPDKVFHGKVFKLMNTLDPTNRVMKMRIVLPNPGYLLKPQMFATVTINNSLNQKAISVPARALIFDNSQYYVIIYKSPKEIAIRAVELISTNGSTAYIKSGLNPGELVIGTNAILIYAALNS